MPARLALPTVLLAIALPARATDITQDDIGALERDLALLGEDEEGRGELLGMLMEGLAERCFPEDRSRANPVARDDWSRSCLERAVEVAEEIVADPGNGDRDRALFVAGKASIAMQRAQAGRGYLERFLHEFPDAEEAPLAHWSLAELSGDAGAWEDAVPHYRAAADALPAEQAGVARLRLADALTRLERGREAAGELVLLLTAVETAGGARDAARSALDARLLALGQAAVTLDALSAVDEGGAPDAATAFAGAWMADGRADVAEEHFREMLARWPDHGSAPSWLVGVLDACWARDDVAGVQAASVALMERFGPDSEHAQTRGTTTQGKRTAAQVEEASRSAVGRLHQRCGDEGIPVAGDVEALYRTYLERFTGAERASDMRMALAALLQEQGRPLEAVDEMLWVVEEQAGRERGARAGRIAAELVIQHLPAGAGPGPMDPWEDRLVRLADVFAAHFPRHPDGAAYLLQAGRQLVARGEAERGEVLLLEVIDRFTAAPEARLAAAEGLEARFAVGDWQGTTELAGRLLGESRLIAAHPDLEDLLGRTRASAGFQVATEVWQTGDPDLAAVGFEDVAADAAAGELAPKAMLNAALCHEEAGHRARAGLILRRLYTRFPGSELAPNAMEREAFLRHDREDFAAAAALLEQLAATYPASDRAPNALYTAGALHDQEGAFEQAIACYRSALERYPAAPEADAARLRLEELTPP